MFTGEEEGNFIHFSEAFKTSVDPELFSSLLPLSPSPPSISSPHLPKESQASNP